MSNNNFNDQHRKFIIIMLLILSISNQLLIAQPAIWVEDHSGFDRKMWPVTGGIPFPKGTVTDVDKIGIEGIPSQTRILSRWNDGSIKWALIDYQSDINANSKTTRQVILSTKSTTSGNILTETDNEIIVDTHALKFKISKHHFSFLDQVWLDLNKNGTYETDKQIVNKGSGQDHFLDLQANNTERTANPYAIRNLKSEQYSDKVSKRALKKIRIFRIIFPAIEVSPLNPCGKH